MNTRRHCKGRGEEGGGKIFFKKDIEKLCYQKGSAIIVCMDICMNFQLFFDFQI